MKTSNQTCSIIESIVSVVVGNLLYALAVKLFLIPSGLITGGTTGIALSVNYFFGVPVSGFVLVFNIVMLIIGMVILGKGFALTTFASTFLYPIFLECLNQTLGDLTLTQDILLCTVFSGLGIGLALGIIIRAGASSGGMDIPPLVLKKLCGIPVSLSMYCFDFCILFIQAFFRPIPNVLYGIILIMIYTIVLDKMLLIGQSRTEIKIVSEKSAQICQAILNQVDRGVTLLNGEGGYLHKETKLILSVISNQELLQVERIVRQIDPECFMVVSRVSEVRGRGFSMTKRYR